VATRGVVVGRVVSVQDHPRGDHIWLASVDLGGGRIVQIVWGGKQIVRPRSLVPVAPPGSRLNGTKIRRRTYRGQASYGMLCSLAELGWDPDVKDRVALLACSAGLSPGTSLDDLTENWRSIIANRRLDWGLNVLTATRNVFSGGWRVGSRGGLERQRFRHDALTKERIGY
jgi:tRNA-binding EMAP/Myf-like protein